MLAVYLLLQFVLHVRNVCSADDVVKKIFSLEYGTKVGFAFFNI